MIFFMVLLLHLLLRHEEDHLVLGQAGRADGEVGARLTVRGVHLHCEEGVGPEEHETRNGCVDSKHIK